MLGLIEAYAYTCVVIAMLFFMFLFYVLPFIAIGALVYFLVKPERPAPSNKKPKLELVDKE